MNALEYNLHLSDSYRNATDAQRAAICNGAGAKNGLAFPGTFWGLDMTPAFDVHDWDYESGSTQEHKDNADRYMMFNTLIIIERQKGVIHTALKPLRRRRALKYYECVVIWGNQAFWIGKSQIDPEAIAP